MDKYDKLSLVNGKELLNVRKSALFLDVSVSTIRRWAKDKKITGLKIGTRGDWRFTKEDLLEMVKSNKE